MHFGVFRTFIIVCFSLVFTYVSLITDWFHGLWFFEILLKIWKMCRKTPLKMFGNLSKYSFVQHKNYFIWVFWIVYFTFWIKITFPECLKCFEEMKKRGFIISSNNERGFIIRWRLEIWGLKYHITLLQEINESRN